MDKHIKQGFQMEELKTMTMVLGFDVEHTARAVEVDNDDMEQVQEMLESEGWTNLVFLEN